MSNKGTRKVVLSRKLRELMEFLRGEVESMGGSLVYAEAEEFSTLEEDSFDLKLDLDDFYILTLGPEKRHFQVGLDPEMKSACKIASSLRDYRQQYYRRMVFNSTEDLYERAFRLADGLAKDHETHKTHEKAEFWRILNFFDMVLNELGVTVRHHLRNDPQSFCISWKQTKVQLKYDEEALYFMADCYLVVMLKELVLYHEGDCEERFSVCRHEQCIWFLQRSLAQYCCGQLYWRATSDLNDELLYRTHARLRGLLCGIVHDCCHVELVMLDTCDLEKVLNFLKLFHSYVEPTKESFEHEASLSDLGKIVLRDIKSEKLAPVL